MQRFGLSLAHPFRSRSCAKLNILSSGFGAFRFGATAWWSKQRSVESPTMLCSTECGQSGDVCFSYITGWFCKPPEFVSISCMLFFAASSVEMLRRLMSFCTTLPASTLGDDDPQFSTLDAGADSNNALTFYIAGVRCCAAYSLQGCFSDSTHKSRIHALAAVRACTNSAAEPLLRPNSQICLGSDLSW